ncbi:MAG: serine hydrolase [Saprospiraceae bacterium]|nr:serine hydrolase [Saprospiraceae bacterium]
MSVRYSACSFFFLLGLLLPFWGISQSSDIAQLDSYIDQARKDWNVPGLSIAIVQDGKVLLSKGYGQSRVDGGDPVGDHTLFAMASTTKAMVAVGMGTLVDAGLVDWDDLVIDHLPTFKLSVPYITHTLRVRDLFTHNSGMGNADHLWVNGEFFADEILERFSKLSFSYPYRGGYTYQNIMYLVAGKVIEKVSGLSWPEFMQQRIYEPLGLDNTYPTYRYIQGLTNRAYPHHFVYGQVTTIEDMIADPIAPAGASWSCAHDMGRWMTFLLDTARLDGQQWLRTETWKEIFKPQVLVPESGFYPTSKLTQPNWMSYGLGWFQHDYRGEMVQFHTGSLNGTIAICGLLPKKNIGVYVFGNLDHAEVRHAIMYQVFDVLGFGDPVRDWSKDLKSLYENIAEEARQRVTDFEQNRQINTQPSLDLDAYTGTYTHPVWGTVSIVENLSSGQLTAQVGEITYMDLQHWHYDVFRGTYRTAGFGNQLIQFHLNQEGQVNGLDIGNALYHFRKNK